MLQRLVAAIVPLLLGITPSLALACDVRCLGEHAGHSVATPAGHEHAGHQHPGAAPAGRADAEQSLDTVSAVHVTAAVKAERPLHHGCMTAFDEGTLDRPSAAAAVGNTSASPTLAALTLAAVPSVRQPGHAPFASPPGRTAIPLRI